MNMEEIEQRRLMEFAMRQAVIMEFAMRQAAIEAQYEADRRIFEEQRRQVDEAMQRTTKKLLLDKEPDTAALRAYFK